jgi:hypothetical protein
MSPSPFRRRATRLLGVFALCIAAPAWAGDAVMPASVAVGGDDVTIGLPRITSWADFETLRGELPLASARGRAGLAFEAATSVDFGARRVRLAPVRFDAGDDGVEREVAKTLAARGLSVDLDLLIDALPPDFVIPGGDAPRLNFDPPRIVVSERPQRLMLIDGPPAMVPIPGTGLEFVVNTDWDVFHDTRSGTWFVLDDGHWIGSNFLSSGDWRPLGELPADFLTLQLNSDWPQVATAMPPRTGAKPLPLTVTYEPTELIVTDGPPELSDIGGGLRYVANTDSDLFQYADRYYYLAAGRWFHTKRLDRQWFAVRDLPGAFAEIPADHARARVLAAVPGTREARRAAVEAAIPRVATVAPGAGAALEVPYLGEPSFVPIEGTSLRRAENSPFQVIRHNNFYYLCHDAAWYAASGPRGPWSAAREIPAAIYDIPPSDPAYNVTFVELDTFDPNSGRAAYVSTGGYYSRYYTGSTMVYGTGWYTPGYYRGSAYWRYPHTYGYGAWGAWGPWAPPVSQTIEIEPRPVDWEWGLDGGPRRVYDYGPRNRVGERYAPPPGARYPDEGGG